MIKHIFRRPVLPIENVFEDVDLYDVIDGGPWIPTNPSNVDPIIEWIQDGKVALEALNPHDYLNEECRKLLNDERFVWDHGSGKSYDHHRLCTLAALYLVSIGKAADCSGNSLCSYPGGWADVRAKDGSLYVECGTLNPTKPMMALKYFINLMIIPYSLGDLAYRFTPLDKDFFKNIYTTTSGPITQLKDFSKMTENTKSNRGFAAMSPERQRAIASKGGKAAHEKGTAHHFNQNEASAAGKKGGSTVSSDRAHMAEIGRKGGLARRKKRAPTNEPELAATLYPETEETGTGE